MQLTPEQFEQIAAWLPRQRGNVSLDNLQVLNAILHVAANGCKWRAMPESYGNWHTIYTRMSRWSRAGVLDRVFEQLQRQRLMHVRIEAVSLDSTIMRAHPDAAGAQKKTVPKPSAAAAVAGAPNCIWLPRMRATSSPAASPRARAGDAPAGRQLIAALGPHHGAQVALLMDSAYEANATRELACSLGLQPVVPPNPRPCHSTADATKSSACSDGSKLGVGFSRATTSSTPCSLRSSRSP